MKQTISIYDFQRGFEEANRAKQFSAEGLKNLFEWLEDYEVDTGEEIEFDVIALCCDYTEFDNLQDFKDAYGDEFQTANDIREVTQLIYFDYGNLDRGFIVQNF